MSRRFLVNLFAAIGVVLLLWWIARASNYQPTNVPRHAAGDTAGVAASRSSDAADSGAPAAAVDSGATGTPGLGEAAALVRHAEIGFASTERLAEHFAKHGAEFNAETADGYLLLAQALRDRPAGGNVLEARRSDGVITRFDRASGAFIAFDNDRTIRTFFRPNDGESYFWRQLGRPH